MLVTVVKYVIQGFPGVIYLPATKLRIIQELIKKLYFGWFYPGFILAAKDPEGSKRSKVAQMLGNYSTQPH